jgi:hypothetical protein
MEAQKWTIFKFSKRYQNWNISKGDTVGDGIPVQGDRPSAVAKLEEIAANSEDAVEVCLFGSSVHPEEGLMLVEHRFTKIKS